MRRALSKSAVSALCLTALLLSGCTEKKPAVPPAPVATAAQPPQQQQPSHPAETQPKQEGQDTPAAKAPEPEAQPPATQPTVSSTPAPAKPAKPKKTVITPTNADKPAQETAKVAPPKVVVHDGGTEATTTNLGQLTPSLSHSEAAHNQATTEQLVESTEANLRNLKRQLSSNEESAVAQIRDFLAQSRQASKDSDLVRARNLAMKAHLLSDDLAKPR
jgi:outer membrane biosynthesis protein TonB